MEMEIDEPKKSHELALVTTSEDLHSALPGSETPKVGVLSTSSNTPGVQVIVKDPSDLIAFLKSNDHTNIQIIGPHTHLLNQDFTSPESNRLVQKGPDSDHHLQIVETPHAHSQGAVKSELDSDNAKRPYKRRVEWSISETLTLISIKRKQEDDEKQWSNSTKLAKTSRVKWEEISEQLLQAGISKTGEECRTKWANLSSDFKCVKDYLGTPGALDYFSPTALSKQDKRRLKLPVNFPETVYRVMDTFMGKRQILPTKRPNPEESIEKVLTPQVVPGAGLVRPKKKKIFSAIDSEAICRSIGQLSDLIRDSNEVHRQSFDLERARTEREAIANASLIQVLEKINDSINRLADKVDSQGKL